MGRKKGSLNKAKKEQKHVNSEDLRPKIEKLDRGLMTLAKKKQITIDDLVDDDEVDVYY